MTIDWKPRGNERWPPISLNFLIYTFHIDKKLGRKISQNCIYEKIRFLRKRKTIVGGKDDD